MDALALLCTLYAEGPSTLQRLRSGGCDSLAGLLEVDSAHLRDQLGWNERLSERFLREAWILAERLDLGWGEGDSPALMEQTEHTPKPERAQPARSSGPTVEPEIRTALREKLLERWRELDRDEPPRDPDLLPESRPEREGLPSANLSSAPIRAQSEAQAQPIDPGMDSLGLSVQQLSRLKSKDIISLRAFVQRDTLELSQLLGLPYTRVQRRKLLAKQADQAQVLASDSGSGEILQRDLPREHSPHGSASPAADHQLDAAGPFA